jgi:hypothetical protein
MVPSRISAEYVSWLTERLDMEVLFWVKSKSLLYKPLKWIYYIATAIIKLTKKETKQKN